MGPETPIVRVNRKLRLVHGRGKPDGRDAGRYLAPAERHRPLLRACVRETLPYPWVCETMNQICAPRRRHCVVGLIAVAAMLSGCINTFRTGPVPGTDENQQVEIPIGQTRTFDEERLAIGFGAVLEDSRCPSDVQCIHAGNARVGLVLQERGEATRSVELNTAENPRRVSHEGYIVEVVGLQPLPTTAGAPAAESYVVRLRVTRG